MAKDRPPSFQFYPRDFMADTGHLTDRQRSHYLLALCRSWMDGGFGVGYPAEWREWFGYTDDSAWKEDEPALLSLLWVAPCDPECWVQKRMASERGEQVTRFRQAQKGARIANAQRTHSAAPASASASASALPSSPSETQVRGRVKIMPLASPALRPTLAEVSAYCAERGRGVDPQAWIDHYTSNGWRVGRNPMRDWKAAVRTWERTGFSRSDPRSDPEAARRELDAAAARFLAEE